MRIFISTGEVSGDLQGAMLTEALRNQAIAKKIDLEIFALGGDRMAAAGAKITKDKLDEFLNYLEVNVVNVSSPGSSQ